MITFSSEAAVTCSEGYYAWLARRTQACDPESFDLLAEPHMHRGLSIATRMLGSRDEAEDVLQEALIAAFTRIDRFDATRPFAPWFSRIVIRKSLNAWARRRGTTTLSELLPATTPAPDRNAERAQLFEQVQSALDGLTPRQRDLVELVELRGFSQHEAAASLGISHGTARWHLHEARSRLRTLLLAHN